MRRFDATSLDAVRREMWTTVRLVVLGPLVRIDTFDDHTLVVCDPGSLVEGVAQLAAIPSLAQVEVMLPFVEPSQLASCVEHLADIPELVLRLYGDQLRSLEAVTHASEIHLHPGGTPREVWTRDLEETWTSLAGVAGLRRLGVHHFTVDARRVSALGIRELLLHRADLTHIEALAELQLESVDAEHLSSAREVLDALVGSPSLSHLRLEGCDLDDSALQAMGRCTSLATLALPDNAIRGVELQALTGLSLRALDLSCNPLEDLGALPRMPALRSLDLTKVSVGPDPRLALAGLERLEELRLGDTGVGQEATALLGGMQALRTLVLSDCGLTDAAFVGGLGQLRSLDLGYNHEMRMPPAEALSTLRHLQTVRLSGCWSVGVSTLSALAQLPDLQRLLLNNCGVAPDHLEALATSESLQVLDASYNDLGDLGLKALAPLTGLQSLQATSCRVGDEGAVAVAAALPGLARLDLDDNQLTDVGAAAALAMPRLVLLDLGRNRIEAPDPAFAGARLQMRRQGEGTAQGVLPQVFVREVLAALDRAFDGVPVPGPESRTLYQAEAADGYSSCDRSRDHLGRWQDLPMAHIEDCHWAFAHLDDAGVVYYLPALLSAGVRETLEPDPQRPGPPDIDFFLTPRSTDALREHTRGRLSRLTVEQRAAIAFWGTATGRRRDLTDAWDRVVQHDRSGAEGSWFDVFWLPQARPDVAEVLAALERAFGEVGKDPPDLRLRDTTSESFLRAFPTRVRRLLTERDEELVKDLLRALTVDWRKPEVCRERVGLLDARQRQAVSLVVQRFGSRARLLEAWDRAATSTEDWFEAMRAGR